MFFTSAFLTSTLTALIYFCINHGDHSYFKFEIIIYILIISFCFIWIPMFWVYGHYKYLSLSVGDLLPSEYVAVFSVDPQHMYSNETRRANKDIYDDFNIKKTSGVHDLHKNISDLEWLTGDLLCRRLHGSYEALEGGWTEDALVDFTGGIGDRVDFSNPSKLPKDTWSRLYHDFAMNSLLGSSIHVSYSQTGWSIHIGHTRFCQHQR